MYLYTKIPDRHIENIPQYFLIWTNSFLKKKHPHGLNQYVFIMHPGRDIPDNIKGMFGIPAGISTGILQELSFVCWHNRRPKDARVVLNAAV